MKFRVSVLSIVAAALSTALPAQVVNDDGFRSGPACSPAVAVLPAFPSMTVNGLGAVIADCGVESQFGTTASLAPVQVLPDYALITLTIEAQPAFTIANQTLVAKYSRTWLEGPPIGDPIQVWRFLVNGDLTYSPGPVGSAGNPIPLSALPPYALPVHFIGNVDFVRNPMSGVWQVSYTLTHFCPIESHAAFSQRPIPEASQWPNRTYHFVGPANFVFDAVAAPHGYAVGESSRRSTGLASPGLYTVRNEAVIAWGGFNDSSVACVGGGTSSGPPRYTHQDLVFTHEFGDGQMSPISSVPTGLATLPTGLRALAIGRYTALPGAEYPGDEHVSVYLGVLDAPGVCAGVPSPPIHAVSGIGTTGGFLAVLFGLDLPYVPFDSVDLHDMNPITPAGFVPGFGSVFGSERVWSFTLE